MGVVMLAVARGETFFLEVKGPDGEGALEELAAFLEDGNIE